MREKNLPLADKKSATDMALRLKVLKRRLLKTVARLHRAPKTSWLLILIDELVLKFGRIHGEMYAAAIAFFMLLSLVPLVLLVAAVGGGIYSLVGSGAAATDDLIASVLGEVRTAVPFLSVQFERDLAELAHNYGEVGLVGTISLVLTSSQVFRAAEFAMAQIFREESGPARGLPPSAVRSKLVFLFLFLALLMGYFVLRTTLSLFQGHLGALPQLFFSVLGEGRGETVVTQIVNGSLLLAVFMCLVIVSTPIKLSLRYVAASGFVFSIGWHAMLFVFARVMSEYSNVGVLYGSFASVTVVVLWALSSSFLFVVCLQLVRVMQFWKYFNARSKHGFPRRHRLESLRVGLE